MKKVLGLALIILVFLSLPVLSSAQEWNYYIDTNVVTKIKHEFMAGLPDGTIQIKAEKIRLQGVALLAVYDFDMSPDQQAPIYFQSILFGQDPSGTEYGLFCETSVDGDPFSDFGQVFSYNPYKLSKEKFHANVFCEFVDVSHSVLLGQGFAEVKAIEIEKKDRINATMSYKGGLMGDIYSGACALQLILD